MTAKKKDAILGIAKIVLRIIVISFVFFCLLNLMLLGIQESTPSFYLASGNTLSGTIHDKIRDAGNIILSVKTEKFGNISVDCTIDQFNSLNIGDTVSIDFELVVH